MSSSSPKPTPSNSSPKHTRQSKQNFQVAPQTNLQSTPKQPPSNPEPTPKQPNPEPVAELNGIPKPNPEPSAESKHKNDYSNIKAIPDQKEKLKKIQELYVKLQLESDPTLKEKIESDKFELGTDLGKFDKMGHRIDHTQEIIDTIKNICLEKYPKKFRNLDGRPTRTRKLILDYISDVYLALDQITSIKGLDEDKMKVVISLYLKDSLKELKKQEKTNDSRVNLFLAFDEDIDSIALTKIKNKIPTIKRVIELIKTWSPEETEYLSILNDVYVQAEKIRIYAIGSFAENIYKNDALTKKYEIELDERILGIKPPEPKKAKTQFEKDQDQWRGFMKTLDKNNPIYQNTYQHGISQGYTL